MRRSVERYKKDGIDGLIDKRLNQAAARNPPIEEVLALADR